MPLDDEDEEGENEEGKPKKKKPKKDSIGSKSKKQDPNAPPQNRWGKHLRDMCGGTSYVLQGSGFLVIPSCFFSHRIPLPELKDSDKLDKIMNMKETTKRVRLGPDCLPSICFYTFLNAYQVGEIIGQFLAGISCRMVTYY